MMTFEEFFTKKKIDLVQLQQAEPALFVEFKKDFAPMGEKSFDHSKKFWFNKLRRLYHLKEEPKPAKTEIEITEIASQAEPLASPTMDQTTGFKPRFRPGATGQPTPPTNKAIEFEGVAEEKKASSPPPAFKPRFKPGITAQANPVSPAAEVPSAENLSEEAKITPAFKPRFSMKTVAVKTETKTEEVKPSSEENKPVEKPAGFKPRFSMKTVAINNPSAEAKPEENTKTTPAESEKTDSEPATYKPKFNMKNIKPKSEE